MTTRRTLLGGALGVSALALLTSCDPNALNNVTDSCPSDPAASGGIDWQPDVGRPVFHGVHDLSKADGPPRDVMIYYPTYANQPANAPMLEKCLTRWPVVLFLHGQPPAGGVPIDGYHRKRNRIPAQLARCGYVVVVPNHEAPLPIPEGAAGIVAAAMADLDWVRTTWTHAQWVDPRPENTAVAGHSYGALTAARIAAAHPEFAALASLSGGYGELPDVTTAAKVNPPSLFMWARTLGDEDLDQNGLWGQIPQWKYSAAFDGNHFDYLDRVDSAPAGRGPCPYLPDLAAALVTLFIAENLPTPLGTTHVGIDLHRPQVQLTPQQQPFASGHLNGLDEVAGDASCKLTLRWDYNTQQGSRTIN